jgi:hypothetical protein
LSERGSLGYWWVILSVLAMSWEWACAAWVSLLSACSTKRLGLSTLACEQASSGVQSG